MILTNYLKKQLTNFVNSYHDYFRKTFGVAISFTVICFVIVALLFRFNTFDEKVSSKDISFLSYFFHRYSKGGTYSIVDLTKTVFLFFVSLFALGIIRLSDTDKERRELSFKQFFHFIRGKDIFVLLGALAISTILDFILVVIDNYFLQHTTSVNPYMYIHDIGFHLRIYLPIILFALAIRSLRTDISTALTWKSVLFLYISAWLFNEFAYEISLWVRSHVFGLILMPFENPGTFYLIESFIGIPLIAFYFLGYCSVMTTGLVLTEDDNSPKNHNFIA